MRDNNMVNKTLLYLFFLLAGSYPYLQVSAGTPACEKSTQKLLSSGYQYKSDLLLVSDDGQHLAAFVVFYTLEKVKGSFYSMSNMTMKLFRYRREGDNYVLLSERGSCEKYFDFEHHRAVMDKDQNIYFYYRRGNSFSYWPNDNQLKIKNYPVSGVNLEDTNLAIDRQTGLIYATHNKDTKYIVRQTKPGDFTFEEWLRFDELFAPGKMWNPLRLGFSKGQLWASMVIFNEGDNFSQLYEYWVFDTKATLLEKQTAVNAYTSFYPGSPATGLRLDFVRKRSGGDGPGPKDMSLRYVNTATGDKTSIIRISQEKSDLSLSSTNFSDNATLFSIYNLYKYEDKAMLRLVTYHPDSGKSKFLLPLLSTKPAAPHKNKRKYK